MAGFDGEIIYGQWGMNAWFLWKRWLNRVFLNFLTMDISAVPVFLNSWQKHTNLKRKCASGSWHKLILIHWNKLTLNCNHLGSFNAYLSQNMLLIPNNIKHEMGLVLCKQEINTALLQVLFLWNMKRSWCKWSAKGKQEWWKPKSPCNENVKMLISSILKFKGKSFLKTITLYIQFLLFLKDGLSIEVGKMLWRWRVVNFVYS